MNEFVGKSCRSALNMAWYARGDARAQPSGGWHPPANSLVKGANHLVDAHSCLPCKPSTQFVPSVVRALQAITGLVQRRDAFQQLLSALGFEWLGVANTALVRSRIVPLAIHSENRSTDWPQVYIRERHYEMDPRVWAVSSSSLPCIWDFESLHAELAQHYPAERVERFTTGLSRVGMRSGVMFGLRQDHASELMLVSLLSRHPGRAWITDHVIGQAMVLALYACEHYPPAASAEAHSAWHGDDVSAVQNGILQCLRQGMGDKVIADRLGLTTHNVDYHLRKLRQRFGARNRVQLVQLVQSVMRTDASSTDRDHTVGTPPTWTVTTHHAQACSA